MAAMLPATAFAATQPFTFNYTIPPKSKPPINSSLKTITKGNCLTGGFTKVTSQLTGQALANSNAAALGTVKTINTTTSSMVFTGTQSASCPCYVSLRGTGTVTVYIQGTWYF